MSISWGTITSLVIFFGPLFFRKAFAYFQSARGISATRPHIRPIQPVPVAVSRALIVLFAVAAALLVKTLPRFAPENIFVLTDSRLQVPVDVLFNRLAALRPGGELMAIDTALRARFVNKGSRLLYAQFGPAVLASCPFCTADEPITYQLYAFPDILTLHLLNLFVIAGATSVALTGSHGARWRTMATVAAIVLVIADMILVGTWDNKENVSALRLSEVDWFHWRMRVWRGFALAGLDALLGLFLYLSSTNRLFVTAPSLAERIDEATYTLVGVKSKISAAGILKNTAIRDEDLRARVTSYWSHDVRLMRDVMEDPEVIDGVNDAVQKRIDMETVTRDADTYAQTFLQVPKGVA